ncbi:MAG TPA: IS3 family transposase [Bryobacteraceae bacterium]|nr:IS3 family transposase [Bryobacteraceae bacterium]
MDRSRSLAADHSTAMRVVRSAAFDLLLPAPTRERGNPASTASARPTVSEAPVLRQPRNGCRTGSEPQAHPASDEYPRHRAHYPKPNLSRPAPGHQVYPYLLRCVEILRPNHVWSTDITYIPMRGGFLYLVAVMDWFSRFVLSWELSNTLETSLCLAALDAAFRFGQPEIWNSDQGSQFTSAEFLAPLHKRGILISMDGRGRAFDNVFIERLWRSLKYEFIYPGDFATGLELFPALKSYFHFYNYLRPHQSLGYQTPADLFAHRSIRNKSLPP